ncbi:sterol desaturase family protein [Parachitinimonas caeni]|uniref:Sterol desaturase family protein n=1 Tax=Parachitinimonas caeni TaxID=3031301 RepID=A0ABT7E528_9NEIS|nr:sterol desaturase family protein [Parachitinimonas caeni]MDK2126027.1 sterol desaturase family protein [Parachitinimonas caeni]
MQNLVKHIADTLLGIGQLVLIAGAVVSLFGLFELWRAAGRGGGIRHRAYNLLIFGLNFTGMAIVGLVLDPLEAKLPNHGLIGWLFPDWKHEGWHGPLLATLVYALVYDFFHYWAHRAQHEIPVLWLFHRVHHDDAAMDASTSVRHSLGAGVAGTLLAHFPTYLVCGGGLLPYAGSVALFWVWFFFSHANLRLHLGWLGWLIVGPQQHRIHHGVSVAYHNRNYAQFFPIYDWLFGTLRQPLPDEWPETGVAGEQPSTNPLRQVFMPWRSRPQRADATTAPTPSGAPPASEGASSS